VKNKNKHLLPALIIGLGLLPASRAAAQTFTTLHSFTARSYTYPTNTDGFKPNGVILSGNTLYGTAQSGGSGNSGAVFAVNTNGTGFTILHDFTANDPITGINGDGANPAGLILSGNTLYGVTSGGGTGGSGAVFKVNTDGTGFTTLYSFTASSVNTNGYPTNSDGSGPNGALILSANTLYGAAFGGGTNGGGTVFKVNTDGNSFTVLHTFGIYPSADEGEPNGGLVLSGNTLFGTTTGGGTYNEGSVFAVNTDGTGYTILHSFTGGGDESAPNGGLLLSGNTLYGTTQGAGWGGSFGTAFSMNTDGSSFTTLANFNSEIFSPTAGLILSGTTLYGTAEGGSEDDFGDALEAGGVAFAVNTDGNGLTILYGITNNAPVYPGGLVLSGNTLYGTTQIDGSSDNGAVFAVNTDGSGFTNLYSFSAIGGYNPGTDSDGAVPYTGLTLSGNTLFGTTTEGGSWDDGTVFKMNADGTAFTTLHSFTALSLSYPSPDTNSDGSGPNGALVVSGNTVYGTASGGGTNGGGTVFAVNTDGTGFTLLHTFTAVPSGTNSDGSNPNGGLVLSGNTLYGTAVFGGTAGYGTVFAVNTDGTGFTNLYNFAGSSNNAEGYPTNSDGVLPSGELVLSGNTLYGTAQSGGDGHGGTVFKVNTDGTSFTVLHGFTATSPYPFTNNDGAQPLAGLTLSGNTLYGTTEIGGSGGSGTVFRVNTDGTGFTTLYNFTYVTHVTGIVDDYIINYYTNSDGAYPQGGLILSGNGLYGTTSKGGNPGNGTVFAVNTNGTGFTTLHVFTAFSGIDGTDITGNADGPNSDGAQSYAGLVLSGNTLFGTAHIGGNWVYGDGTIFSIALMPPPLAIQRSGTNAVLTWPTYAPGVTLLSTTNLVPPAVWNTVTPAPSLVNGQNTVTNPISGTQQFFRLMQ
jgi:uncharacterized repeat protein (TIGR03803 family)